MQQKFFTFEKDPKDNIATFISKVQEIVQQLSDLGEKISDNMVMTKILMALPPWLKHFHSAWESTADSKKTLNELCTRLMMEEKQNESSESGESAFLARRGYSNDKHKSKYKSQKRGKCFNCGSESHWQKDCPVKSKERKSDALCCLSVSSEKDAWYNDSGATEHMSCRREWFKNYVEFEMARGVRIGNGDRMQAVGYGDIDVLVYDGERWNAKYLENAWYVPLLFTNLFSQGRCLDKGLKMFANSDSCEFLDRGKKVAIGIRQNGLYKMLIKTNVSEQHAMIAVQQSLRTWHEKLAHQNIVQVKKFLSRNNIEFVDEKDFQCEACVYGKIHRLPFNQRPEKSTQCGDIIYTDLCGPMQVNSLGGARYFLLLKDDYSHFRIVHFLRNKSDAASKVMAFVNFVHTQTNHQIKAVRSDNGTEYTNKELIEFSRTKRHTTSVNCAVYAGAQWFE